MQYQSTSADLFRNYRYNKGFSASTASDIINIILHSFVNNINLF